MSGETFNFWNDKQASDLDSFLKILDELSYEEFSIYVNATKNDFANWIEGSLDNKELAERVRPLVEKDLIKAVIVDYLDNQNNKLIIGTGNAIQNDSLVREIMKKNEEFFKSPQNKETENEEAAVKAQEKENKNADEFNLRSSPSIKSDKTVLSETKKNHGIDKDFIAGIVFGIVMGGLLTIIIQQIILHW